MDPWFEKEGYNGSCPLFGWSHILDPANFHKAHNPAFNSANIFLFNSFR